MTQSETRALSFNLPTCIQNLKEKKTFTLLGLGILSLFGLYFGYPLLIFKEFSLTDDGFNVNFLDDLFSSPLNVTNRDALSTSQNYNIHKIKWGFDSVTPSVCKEDHVVALSSGVYLSVCKYKENTMIDIRKFTGNEKIGITPTIVGIGLNTDQWCTLTSHVSIIKRYIDDMS